MKKKLLAGVLSAMLVVGMLAGCGGSSSSSSGSTAESKTEAASSEEKAEASAPAESSDEGISADSPYAGKGFDLSERKTVVMYALGDRPADTDMVLEKLNNDYLIPWLNSELQMEFLNWSDYQTKYSLVLAGGETVDLMYTAAWCYYTDEAAKGAFKELTPEFLQQYMPYSYEDCPDFAWDQISINGKIFAVPRTAAFYNGYFMVMVRDDLMEKYGFTELKSWEDYKNYMIAVAADTKTTGISASAQDPTRLELAALWPEFEGIRALVSGQDFYYAHNNSEEAPKAADIFYYYTSDEYRKMALDMAELAGKGCWSSNAINDTNDPRDSFSNGTSASYSYNETVYAVGKDFEDAGYGTYSVYDIAPGISRAKGSYADDAVAIATNSKDPERAALVLDCLKAFPEVNNMIIGGIQGTHFDINEAGERIALEGAGGYAWNAWSWALQAMSNPLDGSMDPRQKEFLAICDANEFAPVSDGFTFDKTPVETELNVINSIRDEYRDSFSLGVYGDKTEAKFDEFKGKIEAAGLDKVTEEFLNQYKAYCAAKGFNVE